MFKIVVAKEGDICESCKQSLKKGHEVVLDESSGKKYHRRCFNDNNIVGRTRPSK